MDSAAAFADIRTELRARGLTVPLVADIHFDHRLAVAAIDAGADKVRINPGNIGNDDKLRAVVQRAMDARIPIRVGVNGGSLERDIFDAYGGPTPEALAASALRNIERVASMGFEDIVVSVKSSDACTCVAALRILSVRTDFPLHIGVTEAGAGDRALVKSAIGMGPLLVDGIGDTMRVSLTGDPVDEVRAARDILASVGMLPGAIDVISCPTCGRCKVNLPCVADGVRKAARAIEADNVIRARRERSTSAHDPFVVAVMGCAVNGPGEAAHADVGVACGDGVAVLFEGGVKVGTVGEAEIISALTERIIAGIRKRGLARKE
jgi:(E)-4-hydroxy-3-methylbut-2-enyl-diphosphate synthase